MRSRIGSFAITLATLALGALFIVAGANHFVHSNFYVRMVPDWLPAHAALVQVSGLAEILGGLGVLLPQTRRLAGLELIALLIAVFPANVEMALHPERFADIGSPAAFYVRLPLQLLLICWVWWACLRRR